MYKYLWIVVFILAGFAAAFITLFRDGSIGDNCGQFNGSPDSPQGGLVAAFRALFEMMLGAVDPIELFQCFSESNHPKAATGLLTIYLIAIVLLALNMLIAMMGATFDGVSEQMTQNYQYCNATAIAIW